MDAAWAEGQQPAACCQACGADTHGTEWLTEAEAAGHLRAAPKTLANQRSLGQGPPSFKAGGRVVYTRCLIDKWLLART